MTTTTKQLIIACLGPAGTYSEQAVRQYLPEARVAPQRFFRDVFAAVERGEADYGMLPIENMIEGIVRENLDLLHQHQPRVQAELLLPIRHCLCGKLQTATTITKILSHAQALAQCSRYLTATYPAVELVEVSSTAEAFRLASASDESCAAVGPEGTAEQYGLTLLEKNIGDTAQNLTRFWVIGPSLQVLPEHDKFTLAFRFGRDQAGSLFEALRCFAEQSVNLTSIYSRPTTERLGAYVFHLDAQGNLESKAVQGVLKALDAICETVDILGSYRGASQLIFEESTHA